jgi:FkbH-like protein
MLELLTQPFSGAGLMRGAKKLARTLRERKDLRPLRVAILGGASSQELVTLLELFLLQRGFDATFWQSEYGRYYEDAVLDSSELVEFKPDLVHVQTGIRNIRNWPAVHSSDEEVRRLAGNELGRLKQIWDGLDRAVGCPILQNNFEMPDLRLLGNLDGKIAGGATSFVLELNREIACAARQRPSLILNDIHYLSAQLGLTQWYDWSRWFSYKMPSSLDGSVATAHNLAVLVAARFGLAKKVLVLDLDNTLWGGVIGDDGVDRIVIGRETAKAEAYTQFQEYCVALKQRGVVLAVCSKNTDAIARTGFEHPDSILKIGDFACFRANWEPKHENIKAIAKALDLGLESFVFVDDNPAERALVAAQLPMVAVPEVGDDVSDYARILDRAQYFEPLAISEEDLKRAEQYQSKAAATETQATFANYGEYLLSLEMVAEAGPFTAKYLDRITQLTNKTNQFNLTTLRLSINDITRMAESPEYLTLYVKLSDRFGDHGLISAVIGEQIGDVLHLRLWLMSCRVLKRDVEVLVLDELVRIARERGVRAIHGYYFRTPKNDLVSKHYRDLGFTALAEEAASSEWILETSTYQPKNGSIVLK